MYRRKYLTIAAAALAAVMVCSCTNVGSGENNAGTVQETTQAQIPEEVQSEHDTEEMQSQDAQQKPQETVKEDEKSGEEKKLAIRKKYQEIVTDFMNNKVLPGTVIDDYGDDFGAMEQNQFAICDVDSDGTEELLISYVTAPMISMAEYVIKYDVDNDTLVTELEEFPAVTYYTEGKAITAWLYNHGFSSGEFWPYSYYVYENGEYVLKADVDSWSKEISQTDYDGNPFPDDKDTDGTGVVYILSLDDNVSIFSESEYKKWYAGILSGAEKIEPQYLTITEENVKLITAGK